MSYENFRFENLDRIMTKPGKEFGRDLTAMDKQDLINFLKTLTDTTFTCNPTFRSHEALVHFKITTMGYLGILLPIFNNKIDKLQVLSITGWLYNI